jgi:sugar lactone lactonase YvrE
MRYDRQRGTVDAIANEQFNPTWIAVDESGVYWTNLRRIKGSVMRLSPGEETAVVVAADQAGPSVVALDATHVYWSDLKLPAGGVASESSIRRRDKVGDEIETIVTSPGHLWGFAVDDQHVYWTNYSEGRLCRTAK